MAMMDKLQATMEATLVPVASKINGQRHVAAVRDAFTLAFPMTLAGSLVMLVNYAVLDPNGFIAKILHLGALIPNLADYQAALTPILQGTTNIMSLLIVFLTAYKLAETKQGDTLLSALCAVGVFFIIYPPYEESGALPMTFMGAQGLFVALIVGLLVGEAIPALGKNEKLRIKMPDGVPPAVAQSFNLVIPVIIVFVIASICSFVFGIVTDGGIQYIIYNVIQVPFRSLGNNIFTVLIFALAQQFLWILGIHGPNTLSAIRTVMFAEQGVANLAYYGETGTTIGTPFPVTWAAINDAFGNTGDLHRGPPRQVPDDHRQAGLCPRPVQHQRALDVRPAHRHEPHLRHPLHPDPAGLQHLRLHLHHRAADHPAGHGGRRLDHPRLPHPLPGFGRT